MKKNLRNIIILVVALFLITSCSKRTEEPQILVTINSTNQDVIYYGNQYADGKEEVEKRLKDFMIGKRFSDLNNIKNGDTIQVQSPNSNITSLEVYDYILDDKCNIISDYEQTPVDIMIDEENLAQYSFCSESATNENTKNGNLIHGILIRCKINKSTFVFAVIVQEEV